MATLTIRNLDATLKERLRVRAAQHGHSMEAEVGTIFSTRLRNRSGLRHRTCSAHPARFAPLGGVDLDLPPREPAPERPASIDVPARQPRFHLPQDVGGRVKPGQGAFATGFDPEALQTDRFVLNWAAVGLIGHPRRRTVQPRFRPDRAVRRRGGRSVAIRPPRRARCGRRRAPAETGRLPAAPRPPRSSPPLPPPRQG